MQPKVADAIADVQKFTAQLERLMRRKHIEDYLSDEVLELAVKMNIVLIAEALRRLDKATPETKLRIPELPQIISFRNIVVHSYDIVDEESAWDVFVREVPLLKQQIDAWAAELDMEAPPETAA